jgi:hypothetical protein
MNQSIDTYGCFDMDFNSLEISNKQIITGVIIGVTLLGLGIFLYYKSHK